MYGYKDTRPAAANTRVITLLLAWTLLRHSVCMTDPKVGALTHWATVPSLRRHDRGHPLRSIAAPFLQSLDEIVVTATPSPTAPRGLVPSNFAVPRAHRPHVLLLDDAWVSGGHAQSVAAALKLAGAQMVSTLVLARWLDLGWGHTHAFVTENLRTDFDPEICPFTGLHC